MGTRGGGTQDKGTQVWHYPPSLPIGASNAVQHLMGRGGCLLWRPQRTWRQDRRPPHRHPFQGHGGAGCSGRSGDSGGHGRSGDMAGSPPQKMYWIGRSPGGTKEAWTLGGSLEVRTLWAPRAGSGADSVGPERTLEQTLWAPWPERTLLAPGLERTLWAPGADSVLRRMELLRRKVGSLELGRRGEPLEIYAEFLGLGWAGKAQRVPSGAGWRDSRIISTSESEPLRNSIRLISSIRGKSLLGRSQCIVSSSNPKWKHAPRAASCQLTWLESLRNSFTYLSNFRPTCRNSHSASSAVVILVGWLFCHTHVRARSEETRRTFNNPFFIELNTLSVEHRCETNTDDN